MNSTHKAEVVRIKFETHPNAEALSIVRVFGYTVCVKTSDWEDGQLAAYIPPDTILPNRPEHEWLGDNKRISAKKMRGIVSFGLLVPAPEGAKEGDNVWDELGLTHWNPPEPTTTGGEAEKPPSGFIPVYDVDSLRRYSNIFNEGEIVNVTEKLNGSNARYVFHDGRMRCGSKTEWKRYDPKNIWWKALEKTPSIEQFCKNNPDTVLYGEVYGHVGGYPYGPNKGDIRFAAFDVWQNNRWVDCYEARQITNGVPWVPHIADIPFDLNELEKLCVGQSTLNENTLLEGVVIRPLKERWCDEIGRVQLKLVSEAYLIKSGK